VVADDGRLIHRQRAVRPSRAEHHHARRGRVHGRPVVPWRHHQVGAAAEVQHQRYQPVGVLQRQAQIERRPCRPGRRLHDAGAQLPRQLRPQRLVSHVDEARPRGAGVDERSRPRPRRDLPEVERGRGDSELGFSHRDPGEGQVVERAEGVLARAPDERHGCHGRRAAVDEACRRADDHVARLYGVIVGVRREAVGEPCVAELGGQRQFAPAEPDDAGRAVQGPRQELGPDDAPEDEARRLRLEREALGAQDPEDVPGSVANSDGARLVVAQALGLGAQSARGVVAAHGAAGARPGGLVMGKVLAEAPGAAGRALRPDKVATGVDDGLGPLRRVADEVLGDVLILATPMDGRGHPAHGRQTAVGALGGTAHALLHGAVLLGVDVDELQADAGTGGERHGSAQEREAEQGSCHSVLYYVNQFSLEMETVGA